MPREAKLFLSSAGSAMRGFMKLRGNITPRWIENAHTSRKRTEPEVLNALQKLARLRKNHPRAKAAIRDAQSELKAALKKWETAYEKESFYRGIRVLLDIQRNGFSKL